MNRKKTVSIIIPVYNAEKYLRECLGNVVYQTLEDLEILLVNDASTDGSLKILKDCEMQFPDRVRVIDSDRNSGPGGARNLGLEAARGEYIGFVDSDDRADTAMFEKMYRKAKEHDYDIVDCGYYNEAADTALLHTSDDLTGKLNGGKRSGLIVSGGYIYSRIFHRRIMKTPDGQLLKFREHAILEDADFLTYLFAVAESVGNLKEILYFYRDNGNSASKSVSADDYYRNIYEAMQAVHQKVFKLQGYEEIREAVEYELLQMYSYGVNMCLKAYMEAPQQPAKYLQRLEELAELKQNTVHGGYDNPYVQSKIAQPDIQIMEMNDENPEKLTREILKKAGR